MMDMQPIPTLQLDQIEVGYDEWVNPFAERNRRQLDDFATRYQLYASLDLPQEPMLRAHSSVNDYMFPRAEPDRLYTTGLMMVYFFIFDYIYDTDTLPAAQLLEVRRRLAQNVLGAIRGIPCQTDHFERALMHIIERFRQEAPDWLAGFSSQLARYIQATRQGKEAARKHPGMSIHTYLELRQYDSGGLWSAYLIEYAHQQYLPPKQRDHPDVVYASQLCMWTCSLLNDLFSYAKEKGAEEAPFNAIYFAMRCHGLSESDASHYICDQANQYLKAFEDLIVSSTFQASESLVSYTQGLREFISGVWYWHQKSGLYNHPRSLFAEMRQ